MKIKNITIKNFRNFNDYTLELGGQTTILIGKNGMGKTNLLSALVKSLSFVFSKPKGTKQYDFIASSDQSVNGFSSTDAHYGKKADGTYDYHYPVRLALEGSLDDEEIGWQFEQKTASSRLKESMYRDAYNAFWECYNQKDEKPVFAYFSDSFPHKDSNISQKMSDRLKSGNPLPQNSGYYKWDDEQSCVEIWVKYFTMQWMNNRLTPDAEKQAYVDAIMTTMREFSMPVSAYNRNEDLKVADMKVEVREDKQVLIVIFENGKQIPYSNLPQGYRRMFSILFDIANRSYLLNKHCNPEGVVFIDEIELHLHPSIAKEILPRLLRAFPRLQFIVSTHSPLVITNFKQNDDNKLFKLFYDEEEGVYGNERIPDIFGLDYNSGLTDVMNTEHTDENLSKLKKAYEYWKERDENKANQIADMLREHCKEDSLFLRSLNL